MFLIAKINKKILFYSFLIGLYIFPQLLLSLFFYDFIKEQFFVVIDNLSFYQIQITDAIHYEFKQEILNVYVAFSLLIFFVGFVVFTFLIFKIIQHFQQGSLILKNEITQIPYEEALHKLKKIDDQIIQLERLIK